MTATTETVTSRAFGKCRHKGCKGRQVLEVQGPSMYTAFEEHHMNAKLAELRASLIAAGCTATSPDTLDADAERMAREDRWSL